MDFAVEIVNYSIGDLQVVDESKSLGGVRVDLSNEELEAFHFLVHFLERDSKS